MRVLITLLFTVLISSATYAKPYNLGIKQVVAEVAGVNVPIRVFYPTQDKAIETRFGPWKLFAARNAKPASGPFKLIVISHGLGGNVWNHSVLAQHLVKHGFVVAAPHHPDDLKRVGSEVILVLRPMEVSKTITEVLNDQTFKNIIDRSQIGAFGFSQGGLTVLRSLGAQASHAKLIQHCQIQKSADEEFCTAKSAGLFKRLAILWGKFRYDAPPFDPNQSVKDPRIKAAVIAAPVGAPITDLSSVNTPLWIIRPAADYVLTFPFHAEYIHQNLAVPHKYSVLDSIEHYAFLSPFPDSIKAEVGLPAIDPEGFNRTVFLRALNQEILTFFLDNLSTP